MSIKRDKIYKILSRFPDCFSSSTGEQTSTWVGTKLPDELKKEAWNWVDHPIIGQTIKGYFWTGSSFSYRYTFFLAEEVHFYELERIFIFLNEKDDQYSQLLHTFGGNEIYERMLYKNKQEVWQSMVAKYVSDKLIG